MPVCHLRRKEQSNQKVCACVGVWETESDFYRGFLHRNNRMKYLLWACFAAYIFDCSVTEGRSDRHAALFGLDLWIFFIEVFSKCNDRNFFMRNSKQWTNSNEPFLSTPVFIISFFIKKVILKVYVEKSKVF